jgi:DNA-binding PucR family transcriptional regulator
MPEELCHEGLKALLDYDKKKKTDYTMTLLKYLEHDKNVTLAAKKMFIHRTSFIRRLDRIKKISGIDFSNKEDMLYLLISCKLIEI